MSYAGQLRKRLLEDRPFEPSYESFALAAGITPVKRKKPPVYRSRRSLVLKATLIPVGAMVVGIAAIPTIAYLSMLRLNDNFSLSTRQFTYEELAAAKEETFQSLNSIKYSDEKTNLSVSEVFVSSVNDFSTDVLLTYLDGTKTSSLAYSPFGLYANLDMVALGCSDEELFAPIFGTELTSEQRATGVANSLRNNFFVEEGSGTVQMKEAAFLTSRLEYRDDYIESLTSRGAEAYQADFTSSYAQNKILEWATQYSDDDFLSKEDLRLDDPEKLSIIYLTLFYFDSYWSTHFKAEDTENGAFHLLSGNTVEVPFMHHLIYANDIEEFDDYVTFSDRYRNGYSIQYFVPKTLDDSIIDIAEKLDEENINMLDRESETENGYMYVDLYVPRLSVKATVDFTSTLKKMGLSDLYDSDSAPIDKVFSEEEPASYLLGTSQSDEFVMNEDGTKIVSLSIAGAGDSGRTDAQTLKASLNQPFVYVIRDKQGVPVFMGYETDPS